MPVTVKKARLGISFSGGRAHILAVRPALVGRPTVARIELDFDFERLDDSNQRAMLLTALRQVKTRCPAGSYRVLVSLPAGAAWLAEAPAPGAGQKPRQTGDEDELSALGPWPLEEMIISRGSGRGRAKEGRALVARRAPLEDLAGLLGEAGLTPAAMDVVTDLLAHSWPRLAGGPREGLAVYLEDGRAQWALLERGRPLASGLLAARNGEGPAGLARRCLDMAVRRMEPRPVSAVYLAGPAAQAAAALAAERPAVDDQTPVIPVHRLERASLMPPDLDWPYLPLWGTMGPGGRAAPGFDLWPGPPAVSRLDNPRLTMILGGAVAILLILAAVQYLALPYFEHRKAQRLVAELKQERAELKKQKQELLRSQDALLAVIQVKEAKEQALAGLLEVAGLLPKDAWLQEFDYSQGGLVLVVQGSNQKQLSQSLARSRLLSLTGEPARAPGPGRQGAWKIALTFQEGGPEPAAQPAPPARPRPGPPGRVAPPPTRRAPPPPPPAKRSPAQPGTGLPRPR